MELNPVEMSVKRLADLVAKSNAVIHRAAPDFGLILNFDLSDEGDRRHMQRFINQLHAHMLLSARLADELASTLNVSVEVAEEAGAVVGPDRAAAVNAAAVLARLTTVQATAMEGGLGMAREEFANACNATEGE